MALVVVGAGDSSYEEELRALVASLTFNLPIFTGWASTGERNDYMYVPRFVLPSDNENFGIAVVEALLSKCPVLISDGVYLSDELRREDVGFMCDQTVDGLLKFAPSHAVDQPSMRRQ